MIDVDPDEEGGVWSTGSKGRKSLELITAIYESIETNTDVQLRFRPKKCRLGIAS